MENTNHLPLHELRFDKLTSTINRTYFLVRTFFLSIFLYHRFSLLFLVPLGDAQPPPLVPCLLLFLAELLLSIFWLLEQGYRIMPTNRAVFVDRLPEQSKLPSLDVLICTADPEKEPTVDVMNTVVSAMALDYPPDKLHVYLSDDGGASVTLRAVKEAWGFATWWVPFRRKYGVKCSCPLSYFENQDDQDYATSNSISSEFAIDRLKLREMYEEFKERVQKLGQEKSDKKSKNNHPPLVQVINEKITDHSIINPNYTDIPLLVYVAREKRPSYHHNFKSGALNSLLRVSSILSNSPVVLVLDCDMLCNDPTSAKQAMCFYLDPDISPSLGFVQFPQRFRNVSKDDLYDTDYRWVFKVITRGMDGLGTGSLLCGTGFYMNRKAILHNSCVKGVDIMELRNTFGPSNEFIKTLSQDTKLEAINDREISDEIIREGKFLASCSYENESNWGKGVGFFYYSVLEDIFTGYHLHCRGWKSVYHDPEIAAFLGTTTTNLNDVLIQHARAFAGLVEVGLSRFCPLVHGLLRRRLPLLCCICYAWMDLVPLNFISGWCLAVIPQLCLLQGIALYPKVSSSIFLAVAFIFLSSLLRHLYEVLTTGGTVASWWNEQRMWAAKMLTCNMYGSIDGILKIIGLKNTNFIPTNKFINDEQEKRYQEGVYDFQTSNMFLVPLGTVVLLNLVCLVGGLVRLTAAGKWDEMAAQVFLSGFLLVMSKPIIEGMFVRKDKGRFPISATLISIAACLLVLVLGPFILLY